MKVASFNIQKFGKNKVSDPDVLNILVKVRRAFVDKYAHPCRKPVLAKPCFEEYEICILSPNSLILHPEKLLLKKV